MRGFQEALGELKLSQERRSKPTFCEGETLSLMLSCLFLRGAISKISEQEKAIGGIS